MSSQPSSSPPASTARYRNMNPYGGPIEVRRQTPNQNPARYRTTVSDDSEWESSNFGEDEEPIIQSPPEPTYLGGESLTPRASTTPGNERKDSNTNNNMEPNATPTRSRTPVIRSRPSFSSSPSSNLIFPTVDTVISNESATVPEVTPNVSNPTSTFSSINGLVSPNSVSTYTQAERDFRNNNANHGSPLNTTTPASPIPDCAAYIGQLRVMIVGDSGVGKTAFAHRLLRAIERYSGAPTADADGHPFDIWSPAHSTSEYDTPQGLTEYLASTAVETPFHITCDDNGIRLPDDLGDPLERQAAPNVTILDTPGYGETATPLVTFEQVARYLNDAFARTRAIYASTISLQELQLRLSPGPGSGAHELVDVIVYLVHRVKRVDVAYLRQLAPYAFVLPCIMYEGSTEPQAVTRARTDVRRSYEKLGVAWHKRKGMMFETTCDERDAMLPFVIHRDSLTNDEGPADDFGELCDLLFRPSRLDWWRHWNVIRFIEWLHRQRNNNGTQETETLNTQQEVPRVPQHSGRQETEAANTQQEELLRGPLHSGRKEPEPVKPQEGIKSWREQDHLRQMLEEETRRQREDEERRQIDEEMRQRHQREEDTKMRYRG